MRKDGLENINMDLIIPSIADKPPDSRNYFWDFWAEYRDVLYRVCLKMMNGAAEDALDALSTAMIFALERFPRHAPGIRNLKAWLVRLTRNVCIDILRKNKKESIYKENMDKIEVLNGETENIDRWIESIEDTQEREEIVNIIYDSVKKLPKRLCEPVVLRFFMKMSYREIANHCNISEVNARKRIQQARGILLNRFRDPRENLNFSSLKKNKRNSLFSSTWFEASRETETIICHESREIEISHTASNIVRVSLPSGFAKDMHIFLNTPPYRLKVRIKTLQDYVQRFPGSWKKRLELAKLQYSLGSWDQAGDEFRRALQKYPQSLEARLYLADILMGSEQEEKAAKILETALPFARKEASRHYIRGMIELCRNQFDPAAISFSRASSLEKKNGAHQQKLAVSYLLSGKPVEAQKNFEKALTINPHDLVSLAHSRECLVLSGQLEKAEELVDRVLEIYPHDIMALGHKVRQRCRRGLLHFAEGKITRVSIRKMKTMAPLALEACEAQAIYHFYRGESKKGLELLADFARRRVECPYNWYYYGFWLYRTGSYQRAAQAVLKTYGLYKKNPQDYIHICEILAEAGMKDKFKIVLRDMLKSFPYRWDTCSTAALFLAAVYGEYRQAGELSARAVELQPGLPEAYFRRGRVLAATGKTGEAVTALLEGWQLLAKDDAGLQSAPAAWLLARCWDTLGQPSKAGAWREETISRAGKLKNFFPAEGCYWEGKTLFDSRDSRGAARALEKALSFQLFHPLRREAESILKHCRALEKNQNREKQIQ